MASRNYTITQDSSSRTFIVTQDGASRTFSVNTGVGPRGADGADGADGATGPQGATGATGATGPAGSDATVNAANVAAVITGATEKTNPVDADQLGITDSEASGAFKRLTFANLKTWAQGVISAMATITGAKTFSGQMELTGQAATNGTSAMTRDLADSRFGGPIYVSRLANSASYTNDATGTAICSVTLPAGTYLMDVFARFTANSANSKITPSVTAGQGETWTGYRGTYLNGGSPARIAGSDATSAAAGPWGATSNSENHERYGVLKITGTATYTITASQNTTSATATTVASGAYIIARKIA